MVFHVWFALGRRADPKLLDGEPVPFVECSGIHIDLQSIQPEMLRRKLAGVVEYGFAHSAVLKLRVNVQVVNEFVPHGKEGDDPSFPFHDKDSILLQDMIAEILAVLVEEMTLGALKFRE